MRWEMMGDIAAVRNGDRCLSYLVIPAFRTHGTGLGDAVTKKLTLAPGASSACPWCRAPATGDSAHAITVCPHPSSAAIRQEWLAPLLADASAFDATWGAAFDGCTDYHQQSHQGNRWSYIRI